MPLYDSRILLAATVFLTAVAVMPVGSGLAAEEPENSEKESAEKSDDHKTDSDSRLSATEYFTLAPFIVPVINDGKHHKQFVLVFAIELEDEDDRDELRHVSPRMRNEIYEMLFKVVSFRTIKPRIPGNEVLRSNLIKVARRVAGEEIVKSIYVHTAKVKDVH